MNRDLRPDRFRTLPDHRDPALDDYGPSKEFFGVERVRTDLREIRENSPKNHNLVNLCNAMLNYISYVERTYEQKRQSSG